MKSQSSAMACENVSAPNVANIQNPLCCLLLCFLEMNFSNFRSIHHPIIGSKIRMRGDYFFFLHGKGQQNLLSRLYTRDADQWGELFGRQSLEKTRWLLQIKSQSQKIKIDIFHQQGTPYHHQSGASLCVLLLLEM